MKQKKIDLLPETPDLLALKALSPGPPHGLGVSRRIKRVRKGAFQVKPDSLFPAFHRVEEAGWLKSPCGESENNRRAEYYRLTIAGQQRRLEAEIKDWQRIAIAITSAIESTRGRPYATTAALIQPLA